MAPLKRNQLDWLVLLLADGTVPAVLAWKMHFEEISPIIALISGLLCIVVMNVAILIAIRRRNGRTGQTTSKGFVLCAAGSGLFFALVTSAAVFAVPQHNSYLDLAFSGKPLSEIQPEQKRLVVELVRHRAANSREYDSLIAGAKTKPITPGLYTPESFANKQVSESTIARLTNSAEADFQYSQKQEEAMSDFRRKMATVDPEYLRSWDAERAGQEESEQRAIQLEREWLESTVSLYGYVGSHPREISLKNGRLEFATDAVRLEFDDRRNKSNTLYQKWQDVTQGLIRYHQQSRAEFGLR